MTVELALHGISMNVNGSMSIQISDHTGIRYTNSSFEPGPVCIKCTIAWPTQVTIDLSNKHSNDIIQDSNGNIIENKAIEIDTVLINNFPIQYELMEQIFNCKRQSSDIITHENFWGFNGKVCINFGATSPMRYMLELNNPFEINRSGWISQ